MLLIKAIENDEIDWTADKSGVLRVPVKLTKIRDEMLCCFSGNRCLTPCYRVGSNSVLLLNLPLLELARRPHQR